jgi:hypothetical protein
MVETTSMSRRAIVVSFVVAELWQLVFGGFSSVQLGAPGVGDRASWIPDLLVLETVSLLPLGFIGSFWGTAPGRILAGVCAAASLALAVVAGITLSSPESSFLYAIPLLAPPGLLLLLTAIRGRPVQAC